jgi:hypothetical protein
MNIHSNSFYSNVQNNFKAEVLIKKIRFQDKFKIDIKKVNPRYDLLKDYKITSHKDMFKRRYQHKTVDSWNHSPVDGNRLTKSVNKKCKEYIQLSYDNVDKIFRSEYSNIDTFDNNYKTVKHGYTSTDGNIFKVIKEDETIKCR